MKKLFLVTFLMFLMVCGNAFALNFSGMTNITVWDRIDNSTYNISSSQIQAGSQGEEDNETEYVKGGSAKWSGSNTVTDQVWDLEGMFIDENTLYIVGGFDFKNGVNDDGDNIGIGDLFFGYWSGDKFIDEYVVDVDKGTLYSGSYSRNATIYSDASNPYNRKDGGSVVDTSNTVNIIYGNASDTETGFSSDWGGETGDQDHYWMSFTLTNTMWKTIIDSNATIAHLTMECGNDTIRGNVAPVPEPTTILLSGLGLNWYRCIH